MASTVPRLLAALALLAAAPGSAAEPRTVPALDWQPDYPAAINAARQRQQHVAVLFCAADAEPCRRLEREELAHAMVREALADLVLVRVQGDAGLAARLGCREVPSLVFVNPFTGGVAHRASGWAGVEVLARELVHARRAMGLPLPAGLEPVAGRMHAPDGERIRELLEAADADGLAALLAPAAADASRLCDYLVVRFVLPPGIVPDDVRFLAGPDCLAGSGPGIVPDLAESCAEYPLPAAGLVLVPVAREQRPGINIRVTAPGCALVEDRVLFGGAAPGGAVQSRRYEIRRLDDALASRLSGRVLRPDGTPAGGAIVRIDGWFPGPGEPAAATRADAAGRFVFSRVPPGRWLVRGECAGGEREQVVEIPRRAEASCEITLAAVTTVGLRWALQTRELVQELVGEGVRTGEAWVSVASSRLDLATGTRVRTADYGDLTMAQTPLADDGLPAETRRALEALPAGTPVWYLSDAAYTQDFLPLSGLHRETRPFAAIDSLRPGEPLPAEEWALLGPVVPQAVAAVREHGCHFGFARGEPVRTGDVFTVRCVSRNCFAKLEVTSVTIVPPAP